MSKSTLPTPEQLDRENQVMNLRRLGYNFVEIAAQTGYADHTGAIRAYKRAMERYQKEPREDLQKIEVERLNKIQSVFMEQAVNYGDIKAATISLKAIELRAKILGLYEPTKIQQEITTWDGDESIDRAVRELASLLQTNATNSTGESSMAEPTSQTEPVVAESGMENLADTVGQRLGQN